MPRLLAVAVAALLLSGVPAAAQITLTTEEYPPFNMTEEGRVVGFATDTVRAIFKTAGVDHTITVMPWQRAYALALKQPDTCVYSTTMTEDRLPLFEWIGPLVRNNWVLLAAPGSSITLDTLDDARPYIIGGYAGDAVSEHLQSRGFHVEIVLRDEMNLMKLINDRIHLWATGALLGAHIAQRHGVSGLRTVLTFREATMALACNKRTQPDLLHRLRAALDHLNSRD